MNAQTEHLLSEFLAHLGCRFLGVQSDKVLEIGDSTTGGTYGLWIEGLSIEKIKKHIDDKRTEFKCINV